jgi:hypothetical protein
MADAGDLEKLPIELRRQVYAYLLVEHKNIPVSRYGNGQKKRVARSGNCRDYVVREQHFCYREDKWVTSPPCTTSLLHVNKVLNQEAAEVLYGLNGFEFEAFDALECFLRITGNSRQHLRRLAFVGRGVLQRYNWNSTDRSLALLAQAGGLRSLEISHATLCGGGTYHSQAWSAHSPGDI